MTATEERPAGAVVSAYGLRQPSAADLRRSIERIFGDEAGGVWAELAGAAQASSHDGPGYAAILAAMHRHHDGAVRLCAESFQIRINSFDHLFKAETIVRSAS